MMMIIIIQHVELITIKKINATKKFAGAIIVIPKRQLLAQKTHMMHGLLQSVHLFCAELTFLPKCKILCFTMLFNQPDIYKSALPMEASTSPSNTCSLDLTASASQTAS